MSLVSSVTLNAASQPQKKNTASTSPCANEVPSAMANGLNHDQSKACPPVTRAQPQKTRSTAYSKTSSQVWKRVARRTPVIAVTVTAASTSRPNTVLRAVELGSRVRPSRLCSPALSANCSSTEPVTALVYAMKIMVPTRVTQPVRNPNHGPSDLPTHT